METKERWGPDYSRFFREYLEENYAALPDKEALVSERTERARNRFIEIYDRSGDLDLAYENAMLTLLDGYFFSKYDFIENILDRHFSERIDWTHRAGLIRRYIVELEPLFARFDLDDCNEALQNAVRHYLTNRMR